VRSTSTVAITIITALAAFSLRIFSSVFVCSYYSQLSNVFGL
jgi:hypothetical protein